MRKIQTNVPARAAAVDGEQTIGEAPYNGIVTSASFTPEAAVTGDTTETRRLAIVNRGQAGAGTTEVAALALATGVNLVANDEKALTLDSTIADREVVAGDVLEFVSDSSGATGLADPGGLVQVEIESR